MEVGLKNGLINKSVQIHMISFLNQMVMLKNGAFFLKMGV